jgi:hypothetical protein
MLCQRIEEHVFEAVVVAATANAGFFASLRMTDVLSWA